MDIKQKAKELKEAFLWYKRKIAMNNDIQFEDIKEEDIKDVEILTEKNK